MTSHRVAAVLLLTVLLTGVVGAEHVLVTAHETVLDPYFVTGSLEDSGAYEAAPVLGTNYASDEAASRARATGAVYGPTAEFETMLDERVPDEVYLDDDRPADARTSLVDVRQVVTTLDRVALALPVVGILLFGLIWWVAGAVEVAIFAGGVASLVVGSVSSVLGGRVATEIHAFLGAQALPPEVLPVVLSLFDAVHGVFVKQSLLLVIAGGACILSAGGLRVGSSLAVIAEPGDRRDRTTE